MLYQLPLSLLSPAGPRARLSILIFHRVLRERDPLFPGEVEAGEFDRICEWADSMFTVLPLHEAAARQVSGTLPARALSITFDDGYADNHDVAMPILQRHGLTATIFVATGFLNGGRMWNDTIIESIRRTTKDALDLRSIGVDGLGELELNSLDQRRAAIAKLIGAIKHKHPVERQALVQAVADTAAATLPSDLMMSTEQVRALHGGGMQIGAHTVTHPILASLPLSEARQEIAESREVLQAILGERVGLFAYPNGRPDHDYTPDNVRQVRELGFDAAVSTTWGAARAGTDCFQLPRFSPWDRERKRFGLRMMRNLWAT